MTDIAPLLAAGKTLAGIADPDKDLLSFATDCTEIATTLRFLGEGLDRAYDNAEDRRDALSRQWPIDAANAAYQQDIRQALGTAKRTAEQALVDLSRLIGELALAIARCEREDA